VFRLSHVKVSTREMLCQGQVRPWGCGRNKFETEDLRLVCRALLGPGEYLKAYRLLSYPMVPLRQEERLLGDVEVVICPLIHGVFSTHSKSPVPGQMHGERLGAHYHTELQEKEPA
jgi:hypothetical protein